MALILVIEDNEVNLELMTYLVRAHGHRTLQARDGIEGLSLARRARPDLVICDVQMPGLDGHGVAAALRDDPATAWMPLVAVTAAATVGDRERALAAGFDVHVAKPFEPADFMSRLDTFLQLSRRRPPHASSDLLAELRAPHPGLVLLLVDDQPVHRALRQGLLQPAGYDVHLAGGVETALSLLRREAVHAVISDVETPDLDGFALLRRLRADPRLAALPFVFLAQASHDDALCQHGLAQGADRWLTRPIEPRVLLGELRSLLDSPTRR